MVGCTIIISYQLCFQRFALQATAIWQQYLTAYGPLVLYAPPLNAMFHTVPLARHVGEKGVVVAFEPQRRLRDLDRAPWYRVGEMAGYANRPILQRQHAG